MKLDKFEKEYKNGLPLFKIRLKSNDIIFETTLRSYVRTNWEFKKTGQRSDFYFIYNEYPVIAESTKFIYKNEMIDVGSGIGNFEDSWGFLI